MRNSWLFVLMWLTASVWAVPDEVNSFVERREQCEQALKEQPQDAEQAALQEEELVEFCTGTDRQLKEIRERYQNAPDVIQLLGHYQDNLEPNY